MKIEVNPNGVVKIDTDAAQALAGIFPIHVDQVSDHEYSKADHTALEIRDAVNASMLPVLFVNAGPAVVPCLPDRTVSHSDDAEAYDFRGWASWYGELIVEIDAEGNAFLPK